MKLRIRRSHHPIPPRFATGIKVEAEGTEHLDQNDVGYIIACNHQSSLDTHCMAR